MNETYFPLPDIRVLAQYHPQFAWAILDGCPVRPNNRIIQAQFGNTSAGQTGRFSFDEQISAYSVFSGCSVTIDPTGAFAGNILKTTSDANQAKVSGIVATLEMRTRQGDYSPILNPIPVQQWEKALSPSVGSWYLEINDNCFSRVTVAQVQPGAPFTVWTVFGFYVLAERGSSYMCLDREKAYAKVCNHPLIRGCWPQLSSPPAPLPGAGGAPPP
jgi:hypothetical protein